MPVPEPVPEPAPEPDPTGAKILDGVLRVLGDFGVKRATVELVAKYAGVSHMTIYRRWPSKSELLTAAVVGEFTALLDTEFGRSAEHGETFAERALAAFTGVVWAVQNHPVVQRELTTDSGEQALASGAVVETAVPLVTGRLTSLAAETGESPHDLDAVADVFVRLAHSLVAVKRSDQPLADLDELAAYARGRFGPYLQALATPASPASPASPVGADVIDLDRRRAAGDRGRPRLQIAAASLLAVLAVSGGLTLALTGKTRLPFITPADIAKSPVPSAPADPATGPTQGGAPQDSEPGFPAPPPQLAPASPATRATVQPAPQQVPQAGTGGQPGAAVGSIGGGAADDSVPAIDRPVSPPRPVPGQSPGPKPPPPPGPKPPPAPGPQPPQPPPPPKPAPPPPGPGPNPGNPGPGGPGPGGPGPAR